MHRLEWNIVFLITFAAGQFLFMLKRADLARRSPLNGMKSIGQYFSLNWVVLLFRAAVEWGVFLYPYRTWNASQIQWVVAKVGINIPFQIPQHRGLTGAFFLGMFSSSFLDWILGQSWVKSIPLLNMLQENIPQLPQVQNLVNNLAMQGGKS